MEEASEQLDPIDSEVLDIEEEITLKELRSEFSEGFYEHILENIDPDQKTITPGELQGLLTEYHSSSEMITDDEGTEPTLTKAPTGEKTIEIDEIPTSERKEPDKIDLENLRVTLGDDELFERFKKYVRIEDNSALVSMKVLKKFLDECDIFKLKKEKYGLEELRLFLGDDDYEDFLEHLGRKPRSGTVKKDVLEKFLRKRYPDKLEEKDMVEDREQTAVATTYYEHKPEIEPELKPEKPLKKIKKKAPSGIKNSFLSNQVNMRWIHDRGYYCNGIDQVFGERKTITKYELTIFLAERGDTQRLEKLHNTSFENFTDVLTFLNAKYKEDFNFDLPNKESVTFREENKYVYTHKTINDRITWSNLKHLRPYIENQLTKPFYTGKEIRSLISNMDNIPKFERKKLLDAILTSDN